MATTYTLRKTVSVAPDPERGMAPGDLLTLDAGTELTDLHDSELRQLAPGHFTDGSDGTPKDWRPLEAQEADANVLEDRAAVIAEGEAANRAQQAENLKAERDALDARINELEG